jgi:hypothetical protein
MIKITKTMSQILFVKIGSTEARLEAFVHEIDNVINDTLASIVWMKLLRVLTNHDMVEKQ